MGCGNLADVALIIDHCITRSSASASIEEDGGIAKQWSIICDNVRPAGGERRARRPGPALRIPRGGR